ncbi:MAG TPA: 6-bladed beta-propeller [Acidobacteriota bacterium]
MSARQAIGVLVIAATWAGCTPAGEPASESSGAWVGTVTTAGDVTIVVNESGSVWGGAATLIGEASIGVETGEPHYMFGWVTAITADEDFIFVGERLPPVIRVYDHDGTYVRDIGSQGQGPGEFGWPASIVLAGGNVLVRDDGNNRFVEFSRDGEFIRTWAQWRGGFGSSRTSVVAPDGGVYFPAPVTRDPETGNSIWGYLHWGPEGEMGDPLIPPRFDYDPPILSRGSLRGPPVPLSPSVVTTLAPFGAWIAGVSSHYRFEIRHLDGRVIITEKVADPIPISEEERDWEVRRTTASLRRDLPDWSWNGPPIGDYLPSFSSFTPDFSGRIWVRVRAASTPVADCDPDPQPGEPAVPCWRRNFRYDVFGRDGRYLGPFDPPPELEQASLNFAHILDNQLIATAQDEAGTIMVKRYRLVLPGEESR